MDDRLKAHAFEDQMAIAGLHLGQQPGCGSGLDGGDPERSRTASGPSETLSSRRDGAHTELVVRPGYLEHIPIRLNQTDRQEYAQEIDFERFLVVQAGSPEREAL
ncbi:hypothetical protein [Breoghania corrubedonensis]|uniref:hypothetical protein n=1 Tax=Breoghania corrubedonensis TaxID=665038 RepID=UPI0011B1ECA5|nr:hypothetical protein [Breoghania corrubedonensis]